MSSLKDKARTLRRAGVLLRLGGNVLVLPPLDLGLVAWVCVHRWEKDRQTDRQGKRAQGEKTAARSLRALAAPSHS